MTFLGDLQKSAMKHKYIKKYTIHIMAVPGMKANLLDLPLEQCAFIILTNRTNDFLDSIKNRKLIVDINDVEDQRLPGAFNQAHAHYIIAFLDRLPEEVTDLYVCCSKGGSRSPACAVALLLMSGRNDKDVWFNPYYYPNHLVFRILCKEFGIHMSGLKTLSRRIINYFAFSMAKKRHNSGKYERWQILE